ncbi:oxidoreductase [Macrococcus animalis]|uniref:oxidoreductase n=1 Tax=Macrococcus animalis TaxID=3395467 RepID=UPI0039BE8AB9
MQNIAIIGAGAVGSILLYLIRNDKQLNIDIFATEERDVIIEKDEELLHTGFTTKLLGSTNKQYDIIFITTKAYTLDSIISVIESLTHEDTNIIICQNGYSQSECFNHPKVFHAVVYISGRKTENKVIYFRDNKLVLPINKQTIAIKNKLLNTHLDLTLADDYLTQIWFKLLVNLGINSMTALTKNTAQILKVHEVQHQLRMLLQEGIMVANHEQLNFSDETINQIINIYAGYPDHMGTSMYYDVNNNNLTEYAFIQGYIYERARYHQLNTPTLDLVYALLKGYQYKRS